MSVYEIRTGDCRVTFAHMASDSIDACVTDPPYELGFMGKRWDASGIAYDVDLWRAVLRVLKPGAHLLAFGGTRTYHRMVCSIEDAGFEIRDSIHWIYGTGFPKSHDVSKAIDGAAGAEREVVGTRRRSGAETRTAAWGFAEDFALTAPATDAAREWSGWGTALKPAHEPIVVARKPLAGTVAENVLRFGTGAINVDGCRVEGAPRTTHADGNIRGAEAFEGGQRVGELTPGAAGRWPPNLLLDEHAAAEMDRQSGDLTGRGNKGPSVHAIKDTGIATFNAGMTRDSGARWNYDAGGGASRFFPVFRYEAKPGRKERDAGTGRNIHPTVKPIALMRWLCRLVTPPGGLILDPFTGSGTTGCAAVLERFRFLGCELSDEYAEIARARIDHHLATVQPELFAEPAA